MSDLKDLLTRLKIDNSETSNHYVYYDDDTKKIHKVSPIKEVSKFKCFSVPTESVEAILTGQVRTEDFYVYFDYGLKSLSIQRKLNENFSNVSLIEVPNYDKGDLSIIIDKEFIKFDITDDLKEHSKNDQTTMHFIITERSNPYVLYDRCEVIVKNLVSENKIKHQLSNKQIDTGLSIYTNPIFNTYSFKVNYD